MPKRASLSVKILLVGPTHPYKGGIAQHTTRLALELEARGHSVVVESWKAQYPVSLYPGEARLSDEQPEIGIPTTVIERLAWYSPWSWWLAGRRIKNHDLAIFNVPTPFHFFPYAVMIWGSRRRAKTVGIVHNVLPHDRRWVDTTLMKRLIRLFDRSLVHNQTAKAQLQEWSPTQEEPIIASLPSPWVPLPSANQRQRRNSHEELQLLFFGTVRPYKGLEVLLRALAGVPGPRLTVAGEFWEPIQKYEKFIDKLGLSDRVVLQPGYVRESDFDSLFGNADVLVLPYISGTGSIVRELGFRYDLPVIATRVGSIAEGITDGVDGRIVKPGDARNLAEALQEALRPETLESWKRNLRARAENQEDQWESYIAAVLFD